ncbi:MAG: hypothetical protein ABW110_13105 [Steroidobacteraceae bacterium]
MAEPGKPGKPRDKDLGTIMALLSRLNDQRLPRALDLKKRVDAGERLTDYDMRFIKMAVTEGNQARRLVAKHPKYQPLVDKMSALYQEIIDKGSENERNEKEQGKSGH